jgi:protein-S-isoprenylcysteine O-methyltransferase Ste14
LEHHQLWQVGWVPKWHAVFAAPMTGLYSYVRHPQYVGFVLIMFGFLLQWPTLITLAMFPLLLLMHARLSLKNGLEAEQAFGGAWQHYNTPRFLPQFRKVGRQA